MPQDNRSPSALSRRRFITLAGASVLASPALAQAPASGRDVDIAIIGGGASGIAAARKIAASGRSYVLLEASDRLAGRAHTITAFGQSVDLGAASFSRHDSTLAAAAESAGLTLLPLPTTRRLYDAGHEARESGYDAFIQALGGLRRDIVAAGDAGRDVPASSVFAATGPWAPTVAALVGPLSCGRGLDTLSTLDLSLRTPPADNVTIPAGIGTMLETLAAWLNVQRQAQVTQITNAGRFSTIALRGQRGLIRARAIVLAVPAAVLASGELRFNPTLPARMATALRAIPAGQIEQAVFTLPGNPFGLSADEAVLGRVDSASEKAAPALLRARLHGSDLYRLSFGAEAAREIASNGAPAALRHVNGWLKAAFGPSAPEVSETIASGWAADPLIRGAMAPALPGQAAQRRQFADGIGRIFLAGDYTSVNQWGTLAGAWTSGETAAARALALLGSPA